MMALSHLLHQIKQEVKIVVASQADTKGFISLEQVTKVGACVVLTCVAITLRIQWRKVLSKLGIFDNQTSLTGHTSPVTSDTSRQDTVKHIHPTNHPINQAIWRSHTHQIARFVFRQQLGCKVQDRIHLFVGFSPLPNHR